MSTASRPRTLLRRAVITLAILVVAWFLLPPILANTPLVTVPLEAYLSRQANAKVEIGQVSLTTWQGPVRVAIAAVDIYSRDGNSFIAFCDSVAMNISPLHLFIGHVRARNARVSRVDIELPTVLLHRYLLDQGYLSQPLIEPEPYGLRQYMSFREVSFSVDSQPGAWSLDAKGVCDLPFLKNSEFAVHLRGDTDARALRIDDFTLSGERVVEHRTVVDGHFETDTLRADVAFGLRGLVESGAVELAPVTLSCGEFELTSRFRRSGERVSFSINVEDDHLEDMRLFMNTRTRSNTLAGINLHAKSHTGPDGVLVTDGLLTVDGGAVRDTHFTDASFTFRLANDQLTSFDSIASVWNGDFHVSLNESVAAGAAVNSPSNQVLLGELAARDVDLNSFLAEFEQVPPHSEGTLNFDLTFDMDNVGITEFLSTRLREFALHSGSGEVTLSNAYLRFFASDQWLLSPQVPELIRNFLGITANLSSAPKSLPLVTKLIKEAGLDTPRTVSARLIIEDGVLATPRVYADTPIGRLIAVGTCDAEGALDYGLEIQLSEEMAAKYGDNPLVAMFRHDDTIDVPVRLTGPLAQPRVELDLTEEERVAFEERLMQLITTFIEQKLQHERGDADIAPPPGIDGLEDTVRGLIRKLL